MFTSGTYQPAQAYIVYIPFSEAYLSCFLSKNEDVKARWENAHNISSWYAPGIERDGGRLIQLSWECGATVELSRAEYRQAERAKKASRHISMRCCLLGFINVYVWVLRMQGEGMRLW